MHVVHLTASTFFGGPERQMLGLADALPRECRSGFISFRESGRCEAFLTQVAGRGHRVIPLESDSPAVPRVLAELTDRLRDARADVLLTHGYKSNVLGRVAARRLRIPIVGVSRGWTGENWKVHAYESLDRWHLRYLDRVVCVSEGQARKVRRLSVPRSRIRVIPNAARLDAFRNPECVSRAELQSIFPSLKSDELLVLAAGRLSPEKGFDQLLRAAGHVCGRMDGVRLLIFGEGAERGRLEAMIEELRLSDRVALGGFRDDLDRWTPLADLVVSSSWTEGLPNVLLEAAAAARPIVATDVGGTAEVVRHGRTGLLVPAGQPDALASAMHRLLCDAAERTRMGAAGRDWVAGRFSFAAQARAYLELLEELLAERGNARSGPCRAS